MLLTLYTIGTYMDRDGIAWPNQQKIAAGIRASVKTVQRHIAAAEQMGWLAIESAGRGGKGWRHYAYRACVPDALDLDDLDETISDALAAQVGDIELREGGDRMMSPPVGQRGDKVVSPPPVRADDTMVSPPSRRGHDRGDTGGAKVATTGTHGGDTSVPNVATQLCRTNSRSETPALRTHASEEAHRVSAVRATFLESGRAAPEPQGRCSSEPDDAARHRILRLATVQSHLPDAEIARICHASVELVREVRGSMEARS